jgi:hypothetical protein
VKTADTRLCSRSKAICTQQQATQIGILSAFEEKYKFGWYKKGVLCFGPADGNTDAEY